MIQKVLLDDSVHISTYDVADQKAVEEPLHIRLNSRSRSVRFVEDENEYFDDSFPRTERECAICWYTNDDTEVFKASLQALLRKAQNEDKKKNLTMMKVIKRKQEGRYSNKRNEGHGQRWNRAAWEKMYTGLFHFVCCRLRER